MTSMINPKTADGIAHMIATQISSSQPSEIGVELSSLAYTDPAQLRHVRLTRRLRDLVSRTRRQLTYHHYQGRQHMSTELSTPNSAWNAGRREAAVFANESTLMKTTIEIATVIELADTDEYGWSPYRRGYVSTLAKHVAERVTDQVVKA